MNQYIRLCNKEEPDEEVISTELNWATYKYGSIQLRHTHSIFKHNQCRHEYIAICLIHNDGNIGGAIYPLCTLPSPSFPFPFPLSHIPYPHKCNRPGEYR